MKLRVKFIFACLFICATPVLAAGQCEALRSTDAHLLKGSVKEVSFVDKRLPKGCFAAYLAKGETIYRFGIFKDGALSMVLPPTYPEADKGRSDLQEKPDLEILAVSFPDLNRDRFRDVLVYGRSIGKQYNYNFVQIYWSCTNGLIHDADASDKVLLRTLDKEGFTKRGTHPADIERIARGGRFKSKCDE